MRRSYVLILLLLSALHASGQSRTNERLKSIINQQKRDTNEVKAYIALASNYQFVYPDSAIEFSQQGLLLAQQLNYQKGEADGLLITGGSISQLGDFNQSLLFLFKALHLYEQSKDTDGISATHLSLQGIYRDGLSDYANALIHAFKAKKLVELTDRKGTITFSGLRMVPLVLAEIGATFEKMNTNDSASYYTRKAIQQNLLINGASWNFPIYLLGLIQAKQGKNKLALELYRKALPLAAKNGYMKDTLDIYNSIASLYKKTGQLDSTIYYAKAIITNPTINQFALILLDATKTLADTYKLSGNKDSTLKYLEFSTVLKDSIYSREKQKNFQRLTYSEQFRQWEIAHAQVEYKSSVRTYALGTGLIILLLITGLVWRNSQQKQRAKIRIEQAYDQLKATQTQLIQKEKMASLGELTAGIAHEIQNPLNFVNNFSEVSTELVTELEEEQQKANRDSELEAELLGDLKQNLQKITHHGGRASSIVKGMLEHARTTTGERQPTDLNALADEYLRLAYQGLRAKDKDFNAALKTDFDPNLPMVCVVPQEIGRVLLNLLNNAFYATQQKKALLNGNGSYQPEVNVSTLRLGDQIVIRVKDNGMGIPPNVVEKIFQPFFTTKPTGEGTGLGLSLSYDIITKGHGGELNVETKEGEFAEFIIQLPINK